MTTNSNTIPNLMTTEELAKFLRKSPSTIYRLVNKRQIPFYKIGRDNRFNKADVLAFLESKRIELATKYYECN